MEIYMKILKVLVTKALTLYKFKNEPNYNLRSTTPIKSNLGLSLTVYGLPGAGKTTLLNLVNILLDQVEELMPFETNITVTTDEVTTGSVTKVHKNGV